MEPRTLPYRLLLLIVVLGIVSTAVELLLLGHTDSAWQWTPLVALALGLPPVVWALARPSPASLLTLRTTMLVFVVLGGVGIVQHYRGNVEFELEMRPSLHGRELFSEAIRGATPALAPSAMAFLGFVGLVATLGHPTLSSNRSGDDA